MRVEESIKTETEIRREALQAQPELAQVYEHWNAQACGSQVATSQKFTKEYFDEIENARYSIESDIFSFAQFTRFRGQKMLEVGIGAATDFVQWVRAGARAHGIDLTDEAIEHAKHRLALEGLKAEDLRAANCEMLPYEDNSFDLVYSWGVIHHSPDTQKALSEIVRVAKPGGLCKIMIYHRHSLVGFYEWVKWALLKGRPWKSISWCLYHCVESIGTKAFTRKEVRQMLKGLPVENLKIEPILTYQDTLGRYSKFHQAVAKALILLAGGRRAGWFMTIQFVKAPAPSQSGGK